MIPIPAALVANWKAVLGGLLLAALALQTWRIGNLKADVANCATRNLAQVSEWRAKYAEAVSQATAAKAATEAAQAKVTSEVGNDTQKRLDALRASLDRLRKAATNPGSPSLPYLPVDPSTAVGADAENASADMVDRERCGRAFIVATGWQAWHRAQSQIDRSE